MLSMIYPTRFPIAVFAFSNSVRCVFLESPHTPLCKLLLVTKSAVAHDHLQAHTKLRRDLLMREAGKAAIDNGRRAQSVDRHREAGNGRSFRRRSPAVPAAVQSIARVGFAGN